MAERDSWATTGTLDQEESRVAVGLLLAPQGTNLKAKSGFRPGPGTSPGLVSATGTPDALVHVAPFQLALQTIRATTGGPYLATLDTIKDINILSTPAHSTNARFDLIIAQQSDTFYADGSSPFEVKRILGTPAGSPVDPTVTGSGDYVPLARVTVGANVTTITGAAITDLRTSGHAKSLVGGLYTAALGGTLPVDTQAQRDALTGVHPGFRIYRIDRGWEEVYHSSNFRVRGTAHVSNAADLTAITNPYGGQRAERTDGNQSWTYTGSAWRTTRYREVQTLGSPAASVTFTPPTGLRTLRVHITARGDTASTNHFLLLRIGSPNDTGNFYRFLINYSQNGSAGIAHNFAQSSATVGYIPAATSAAGVFGAAVLDIHGWQEPHSNYLTGMSSAGYMDGTSNDVMASGTWSYLGTSDYLAFTLFMGAGNIVAGSEFMLLGWD